MVVDVLEKMLIAEQRGVTYLPGANDDLWALVSEHVSSPPCGWIAVEKTKAHVKWQHLSGQERVHAQCNEAADLAAEKSLIADHHLISGRK